MCYRSAKVLFDFGLIGFRISKFRFRIFLFLICYFIGRKPNKSEIKIIPKSHTRNPKLFSTFAPWIRKFLTSIFLSVFTGLWTRRSDHL